jgi:hypothetical protein
MKWFLRSKGIKPTNNDIAVVDLRLPVAKPKDYENQDDGDSLANTITVVDRHVGTSGEPVRLSDGTSEAEKEHVLCVSYIKDVMGSLVAPELQVTRRYLPRTFELIKAQGYVDIP